MLMIGLLVGFTFSACAPRRTADDIGLPLMINYSIFEGCGIVSENGGCLFLDLSRATQSVNVWVDNCVFRGYRSTGNGGAIYFLGATNVQTPGRVYFHRICGFNCSAFSNSSTVCHGAFGYVKDANAFQMNLSMLFQSATNVSTFQVETPTNVVLNTGNSSLNSVTHAASALSIGTSCTTCNISYWAFLGNEAKGVLAVARVGTTGSGTISNLWFINNTCDPDGPTASPAYAQHALVVVAGSQTDRKSVV
jgi:hypothetical protein